MSKALRQILYRKSVLTALLVLIFIAFFGMLALSARMFPQDYDWRYRVISNLLSPRDNPGHHWLAAFGIIFTAALMIPFAGHLRRNLQSISPHVSNVSAAALVGGIIALICACLVVPQHLHDVLGIRRLHEFIARLAAGLLATGMISACWCAWIGSQRQLLHRRLFWIWSLVTFLPLAGILVSESLLILTRVIPVWTIPIRNTLRHSIFWHLGFWEWLGSAAVFIFLCAAVFFTSEPTSSTCSVGDS
jgi:hypothetical protein